MNQHDSQQAQYFGQAKYRSPEHPVVLAYATPKVHYLLKSLNLSRQSRILDLACGNGVFTRHLSRISDFTVGLDLSSHLLAENRYAQLVCGDAHVLPFSDASFDVVFEANLLHHVTNPAAVIEQMKRVSCRYVVFVEPNRLNPLMFLFSLVVPAERGVLRSSERTLKDLVERCGLRCHAALTTGMISQNNTPGFLVPWLKQFDRPIWWGEYTVLVAEKQPYLPGRSSEASRGVQVFGATSGLSSVRQ